MEYVSAAEANFDFFVVFICFSFVSDVKHHLNESLQLEQLLIGETAANMSPSKLMSFLLIFF